MPFMQIGDKMRIGYDPSTGERGTQMRLINKTGVVSKAESNAIPPGGTVAALEDHLEELGHAAESQVAGTDVLALIHFHVN